MSMGSEKDDIPPISETKGLEVTIGSHYALQVALQTMKERCQQLQQRLVAVEGENLSLKVEKEKYNSLSSAKEFIKGEGGVNSKSEIEQLQQQVAQLVQQKSQLTHHIYMVATENKQLWSRLSRLTQANQSLGSHLTKISDTLNQHPASSTIGVKTSTQTASNRDSFEGEATDSKDRLTSHAFETHDSSLQDMEKIKSIKVSKDSKEESLEEISLKLIKSLLLEKTELEQQYAQMVEIQTDCPSFSVPDLGFTYEGDGDESIVDEVRQHCERLQCMKETLQEQHCALREAVGNMERIKNEGVMCKHCEDRSKMETETMDLQMESLRSWAGSGTYPADIQHKLNQVVEPPGMVTGMDSSPSRRSSRGIPRRIGERSMSFHTTSVAGEPPPQNDWMCPLCSRIYSKISSFEEFHQHVLDHFSSEDDIESHFEIIQNDLGAH